MDTENVLSFWFRGTAMRKEWFEKTPGFDAEIRSHFLSLWDDALAGRLEAWRAQPRECLAYVIVCDQFPRNMFRGEARAFTTDTQALAAARQAVEHGWHVSLPAAQQMFFYLPFEHSEVLADQERSLELFNGHQNYEWAVKHWEIVKRFGRFPHRNAALGRENTAEELAFLGQPGSSF